MSSLKNSNFEAETSFVNGIIIDSNTTVTNSVVNYTKVTNGVFVAQFSTVVNSSFRDTLICN